MRKYALRFTLLGLLVYIGILFGLSMLIHGVDLRYYVFMLAMYTLNTWGRQSESDDFNSTVIPTAIFIMVTGGLLFLSSGAKDLNSITMFLLGGIYWLMGVGIQERSCREEAK